MYLMVTGHRPPKLGGYDLNNPTADWVQSQLYKLVKHIHETRGIEAAVQGMALGADQMFGWVCIDLKIKVIAAIPFKGQEGKWPSSSQESYHDLLEKCIVREVCEPGYAAWKMHKRNEFMVELVASADKGGAIAVWNGSKGGTSACIDKLKEYGVKTIVVDPQSRRVYRLDNGKTLKGF